MDIDWNDVLDKVEECARLEDRESKLVRYDAATREPVQVAYLCAHSYLQETLERPPSFSEVAGHLKEYGITRMASLRAHEDLYFDMTGVWHEHDGKRYKSVELPDTDIHKRLGWPPETRQTSTDSLSEYAEP